METIKNNQSRAFFTENLNIEDVFIKEDCKEEHQMIAEMTKSFVEQDLLPLLSEIEQQNFSFVKQMIEKCGELGLLDIDIPEKYGGMELDKISAIIITEEMAKSRSFSITYSGQVGIGSLPIVYYGSEEQKKRYLPSVATGQMIGAYALTEPNAGTDAMGIKTVARLSEDRTHYILDGEKQFITNASFADFLIVYAKIDGEHFTAFIVEKDSEGLTIGPEERKMGLTGSSTTSIVLNDVKVPVENILGEIGKGYLIAFNILNIGRHKLSAHCLGIAKRALELAIYHVKERKQFNRYLSEFNLTKEKIAIMAAKIFAMESMIYRTAGEFEKAAVFAKENGIPFKNMLKSFALECSINKVFSSESQHHIVDEALQLHGGYGFINDYEIETHYRDSRINRIFEGTNEINRMVIANTVLKHIEDFIINPNMDAQSIQLTFEWDLLHLLKDFFYHFTLDVKKSYSNLTEEQELLAKIADFAVLTYAIESCLIRVEKLLKKQSNENIKYKNQLMKVFIGEAFIEYISKVFTLPINSSKLEGKLSKILLKASQLQNEGIIVKRQISSYIIEKGKYE